MFIFWMKSLGIAEFSVYLTLTEIEMLNRVQLGKPLADDEVAYLRKHKLVEGRKNALIVSKEIAQQTGQKIEYSKHKGLDDSKCEALLLTALNDHGKLSFQDIKSLLWNVLSDILDDSQKNNKIKNLLKKMKRKGLIENESRGNISDWFIPRG